VLRRRGPVSRALAVFALLVGLGCSRSDAPRDGPVASAPTLAAAIIDPPPPVITLASPPRKYRVVLHTGDSTVGGGHGLARALKTRFEAEGARYISDTVNNATLRSTQVVDHIGTSIARHQPDLVLVNLGTNEVFVPAPEALERRIHAIVKRIGSRDCVWIGPPTWNGDRGIVQVLRANAFPCRFFDSSNLDLERIRDGIHPTDRGGEQWAQKFWAFFRAT
jgi:lysophospholipase L1-like esterase